VNNSNRCGSLNNSLIFFTCYNYKGKSLKLSMSVISLFCCYPVEYSFGAGAFDRRLVDVNSKIVIKIQAHQLIVISQLEKHC
jgi:hypothetical protein